MRSNIAVRRGERQSRAEQSRERSMSGPTLQRKQALMKATKALMMRRNETSRGKRGAQGLDAEPLVQATTCWLTTTAFKQWKRRDRERKLSASRERSLKSFSLRGVSSLDASVWKRRA
jgi:hypothetical protein